MSKKEHLFDKGLIKESPTIARMDEIYLEELAKAIFRQDGENLSYEDLEEASRIATERLAEEQSQGLIE